MEPAPVSFFPTTRVDVETVTESEDSYGDAVGSWSALHANVRATITERRRRVWNPTDSRAATIVWYEGLLPGELEVPVGSRLRDRSTGVLYHVTSTRLMHSLAFPGATQRVELEVP